MNGPRHHRQIQALALAVIACALMLRLMVPAGWMPVPGTLRIVPCSGFGPEAAPTSGAMAHSHLPMFGMTMPGHHDPTNHKHEACPYTALRMAADAPTLPPAILVSVALLPVLPEPAEKAAPARGLAAPPPAQTGPPRRLA